MLAELPGTVVIVDSVPPDFGTAYTLTLVAPWAASKVNTLVEFTTRPPMPVATVPSTKGWQVPFSQVPPWQLWPQDPQLFASVPLTLTH